MVARECPLDCHMWEVSHSLVWEILKVDSFIAGSFLWPLPSSGQGLSFGWLRPAPQLHPGILFTSSFLLQSLHPGGEGGGPLHSILSILPLLDGWVVVFKVLTF